MTTMTVVGDGRAGFCGRGFGAQAQFKSGKWFSKWSLLRAALSQLGLACVHYIYVVAGSISTIAVAAAIEQFESAHCLPNSSERGGGGGGGAHPRHHEAMSMGQSQGAHPPPRVRPHPLQRPFHLRQR